MMKSKIPAPSSNLFFFATTPRPASLCAAAPRHMYNGMYHIHTAIAAIAAAAAAAKDFSFGGGAAEAARHRHIVDEWEYIAIPAAETTDIILRNTHTFIEYRESIFHEAASAEILASRPTGISAAANSAARISFAPDSKTRVTAIHVFVFMYDGPTIDTVALLRSHALLTARVDAAEDEIERLRRAAAAP